MDTGDDMDVGDVMDASTAETGSTLAGRGGAGRPALALLVGAGLLAGSAQLARWTLPQGLGPAGDPVQLLVGAAAVALAGLVGWLLLCMALTLLARLPGAAGRCAARWRRRLAPRLVRRWAALAVGLAVPIGVGPAAAASTVATSVAAPGAAPAEDEPGGRGTGFPVTGRAGASADASPETPSAASSDDATVQPPSATSSEDPERPGWTPQRPTSSPQRADGLLVGSRVGPPGEGGAAEVVVRRGDTLWSIAARALGPGSTDLEIARAWPDWHEANRAAIGPDPDHLLPGTRLQAPTSTSEGAAR